MADPESTPQTPERAAESEKTSPLRVWIRILVVDDEIEVQRVLARALQRAGFSVEAVGSFQEARDSLGRQHYHLLIVDLALPDQSGIDLVRDCRDEDNRPSVIIVTGHPSVTSAVEGMQLGVRNYLTKPVSPRALVEAVEAVLAEDGLLINTEERLVVEVGRRLKTARQAADLTMKQVGDRIGMSQALISQIEAGLSPPTLATLFRMSRALQVKLSDLLDDF